MSVSQYGRILQNLTSAYDEIQNLKEVDYPNKAELASYFITMSIDATQDVVRHKLGYREPEFLGPINRRELDDAEHAARAE